MCAKDDLVGRKGPLSTSTQTPNYVDTFGLDFAFSFANILSLIAFIISYRLFADELNIQQSLLDRATVVLIIILVDKTQLSLILGDRLTPSTLLARFIPITKICDPLLKTLKNAAKSRILLACADGRTRQCYLTICAILRCLDKGHDDFVHLVDCFGWKHYNFNIHVSLATDILHLLLKGLVMKMLDFMQDITGLKRFNNKRAFTELVAVVSPLFVLKAPFALHFIRAVCDLVTLAQYKSYDEDTLAYIQGALERMNVFKEEFRVYQRTLEEEKNFNYSKWHALTHIIQDIRMYGALDSICTRANSEAHYITMLILGIQPHSTKLPLSEVAVNIAISDFIYAAAVFDRLDVDLSWVSRISVQIHPSIKCWRSSSKRHNDSKHCDEEVVRCAPNWQQIGLWRRDYVWLYLILTIINYICYDKDGKHMAYIRAFSKVLLFNNNGQIDNTTRMLSVPFKFYDLSTIIRLVHLVPRDLPNLTTHKYNRLYSLTFDIDLLRTLREY
ncbi:hypothetical protein HBI50_219210 [Parastagonospora nodorum]|nr:hypothetical protein HBI50_219210 [Parastagonospora nodorum]